MIFTLGRVVSVFVLSSSSLLFSQTQPPQEKTAPEPDLVVFANGEQLTGDLEQATGDSVTFKSAMAGEITLKWDNIKELRTNKPFAVLTKNEKLKVREAAASVPQGNIVAQNKKVQVNTAGGTKEVPLSNTDHIVPEATFQKQVGEAPGLLGGWVGAASAGVSLVRATQNSTTFTGALNLVRATPSVEWLLPKDRTLIDYNQAYGSTSQNAIPTIKTNIFHADAEQDRYFRPRVYAFGAAAFDHNFSQGLDLQQQYGGGIGWTAIKNAVEEFDLKGDIHYQRQQFFDPTLNQNLIGSTFGETYLRKLPRTILLTEAASISPAWNNTNAYSAEASLNLVFPVYRGFAFHVGAIDDYLNNAPAGFRKNSVQFTTGLTYVIK